MTASLTEHVIRDQFPWWEQALGQALPDVGAGPLVVTGCGTSYYLAQSLAAAFNAGGQRAVAVPGAEWARRPGFYVPGADRVTVLGLSRSGTTTETVQALEASRRRSLRTIGLSCAPDTPLLAASDLPVYLPTDPREGIVMSVSASLMLLAGLRMAGVGLGPDVVAAGRKGLAEVERAASLLPGKRHFVYLGAGANYGIANEGCLKLQEMSISYAQSFHPLEYRHGPISLIDEGSLVVMLYSADRAEEEARVVQDVQAKGAKVLGLGGPGDVEIGLNPAQPGFGLACLPALQLLGEMLARHKGIDSEAPRHLTKVVTLTA